MQLTESLLNTCLNGESHSFSMHREVTQRLVGRYKGMGGTGIRWGSGRAAGTTIRTSVDHVVTTRCLVGLDPGPHPQAGDRAIGTQPISSFCTMTARCAHHLPAWRLPHLQKYRIPPPQLQSRISPNFHRATVLRPDFCLADGTALQSAGN